MEALECFNSYNLNTNFRTLLTESIPEIYGIDKTIELYKVCGIAPENLDPFQYRDRFFVKGETTNILSTDTNANVSGNSIVQYQDEVHKGLNKLITYNTLYSKLEEYYDTETANTCLKLLLNGTLFLNDSISFDLPYCYGFDLTCLLEGLTVGNNQVLKMRPAKHSRTFISQFIQLLAVASAELLGACAFPNFFVLLDWFYRKEFGDAYVFSTKTNKSILQDFQHIIYSVNWNFRRSQTAFTNLSALDFGFLKEIFGDYVYPDFTKVNFVSVRALSMEFFEYFEELYGKDGVPTFPVMTLACSLDRKTNEMIDPEFFDWACETNHRKSIANVLLTTPDSFSSCCRLKNELSAFEDTAETKNYGEEGFQNSFGVGSVSVGSHRVCGINLPRLPFIIDKDCTLNTLMDCIHKILLTHRRHLQDLIDKGLLPLYQYEVMFLNKQYGTIGFIGVPEFHKNNINNSLDIVEIFNTLERCTKSWKEEDKQFRAVYNIEQIPGEMMASRLATQDTILGYNPLKIELYSNQYIPLTEPMSIEKRLQEQAKYEKYTSGGSILHISMFDNEPLSKEHYKRILQRAYELGVTYIGVNYCYSVCEQKHTLIGSKYDSCPICGKPITDIYTRVVGFIVPVRAFSIPRQKEFPNRQSIKTSEFEVL